MGFIHSRARPELCIAHFHCGDARDVQTCAVEFQCVSFPIASMYAVADMTSVVRVENEHLGNVDQYRVTREVPLPYSIEELAHESEGDEDMDEDAVSKSAWRNRRRALSIARKDKNNDQA